MEKSSFFNSVNGDRKYKASDYAEYFASFIGNGIFPNPSSNLQVMANNDMTVTLKAGKAWINGYFYVNTDDLVLSVDVADGVLNRIDRVVIRLDTIAREIKAAVKKGTFASSPVAPVLQRDADAYELGLADIYVGKGAVSITQANITDLRMNSNICGIVKGTVDQINTTNLFAQYQAAFEDWFETVQDALDGDTAGQLLNLINANTTAIETKAEQDDLDQVSSALAAHEAERTQHVPYAVGVAPTDVNWISASISPAPTSYVEGMAIAIKIPSQNTQTSVNFNLNGLGWTKIKKANGNDVGVGFLKAGSIYTLRYNGTNFILQGEGGEVGTATPLQVLQGYTVPTENGLEAGTIPIVNPDLADSIPAINSFPWAGWGDGKLYALMSVPAGTYLNGVNCVRSYQPHLIPQAILQGYNIFGVAGTAQPAGFYSYHFTSGNNFTLSATSTPLETPEITISGVGFTPTTLLLHCTVNLKWANNTDSTATCSDLSLYRTSRSLDNNFYQYNEFNLARGPNVLKIYISYISFGSGYVKFKILMTPYQTQYYGSHNYTLSINRAFLFT